MRISDWSSDVCSSDLEAQVGTFHARAVDEDLAIRPRLGQVRHAGAVELEPDVVLVAAVVVDLVVAGEQGGVDAAHKAATYAVHAEAGDAVEQPRESGAPGGVLHVRALGDGVDERPTGVRR